MKNTNKLITEIELEKGLAKILDAYNRRNVEDIFNSLKMHQENYKDYFKTTDNLASAYELANKHASICGPIMNYLSKRDWDKYGELTTPRKVEVAA